MLSLQYFKRDSYIVARMSGLSSFQWKADVAIAVAHLAFVRSQFAEAGIRRFMSSVSEKHFIFHVL